MPSKTKFGVKEKVSSSSSAKQRELYDRVQEILIGSLIADSSSISSVLEIVNEEDIEEPKYALIFNVVSELSRRNEAISDITIISELQSRGHLEMVGGTAEIFRLKTAGEKYLTDAPISVYSRIVKESSAKAKTQRILEEALPNFEDDSGVAASDAISEVQSSLNENLLNLSDSSTITNFSKQFDEYSVLLEERLKTSIENEGNAEGLQGIPSLLPSLNAYTTGWLPGQMITVGAGTGVGKSVMAVNCAVAAAMAGKSVMFFSLEMSRTDLEDRIVSSTTGIPMKKLKQGRLSEEERATLAKQQEEMKNMTIIIDVEPKQTIDSIRARALRQAQTPAGLDFIIIDYLQLITSTSRHSNRQEIVAEISRNSKLLAKQLNIPIMVLVQMKRKSEDSAEESSIPRLDDIRESGAIAQDSDIVILLHREISMDDTTPHTLVILAKNRGGENNKTIRCHSNLGCSVFREVTRVKDVEELSEKTDYTDSSTLDDSDSFEELDEFDEFSQFVDDLDDELDF